MKVEGNLSREFLKKRLDSDTDSRFDIQLMFKLYTFRAHFYRQFLHHYYIIILILLVDIIR